MFVVILTGYYLESEVLSGEVPSNDAGLTPGGPWSTGTYDYGSHEAAEAALKASGLAGRVECRPPRR